MCNKSINTKKSNFLKILKKRKSNNILNKFSKINLNLLIKIFLIIFVLIISFSIIYINISYFELIGDYQYYDDFESDIQQKNTWGVKKLRLYYEQITDEELNNALAFFTPSYDKKTENISPAERLYSFRRGSLKPTLADYYFWSKFNLIKLTEKQYVLLDKLIFEKIGNHELKDLTEQEMSFIWHAYRLAYNNEELLRGILNFFYFHSPSFKLNVFTYPDEMGGRAFWLKYVSNVNTVMGMGLDPKEILVEQILSKEAPFYTWRYQGIPLFDNWKKLNEAFQAYENKKYIEKKYPLASIDEYEKRYTIGKDIDEKIWEAMQHNPLPFTWNLELNWNPESKNKIELTIHGPKWQWKPTNIKPDILINYANSVKKHYEQAGDVPIDPPLKKDDLVIIFAPCNLIVKLKKEPSLVVDPWLINESVMDKITKMDFTFPKKSEFNSNDLHNLSLLERTLKKKVIIIFLEPHNVLLRLAGGFNLFEEFLTTDNIFFLKPFTYEQHQELARIRFVARLKAGWERNHIHFTPKWEEILIKEYTNCWEIFSKKWADDEEIQICLLLSEGRLFLGKTITYTTDQQLIRWHYPTLFSQPDEKVVFLTTAGSLDSANFSIFHKAISHYSDPRLVPREAIIEWTKSYSSYDREWVAQVIKDRPDVRILQTVKKPTPPIIINIEENLNEKTYDAWWEFIQNDWAKDIPVDEPLESASIPPDDNMNTELETNKQWIVYTNFIKDRETFMQILLLFFKSPDAIAFKELKGLFAILSISFGCFIFCLRFIWGLFKWCCIIIIWFLLFSLISFFCVWFTQAFAKLYEIIKLKKSSSKIKTTSKTTALTLITYYFRPDIEEHESSLRSEFYKILSSILGPKGWFYRDGTIWIERLCIKFDIIQKPPIRDKWHTLWSPLMRNGELVYTKAQTNLKLNKIRN